MRGGNGGKRGGSAASTSCRWGILAVTVCLVLGWILWSGTAIKSVATTALNPSRNLYHAEESMGSSRRLSAADRLRIARERARRRDVKLQSADPQRQDTAAKQNCREPPAPTVLPIERVSPSVLSRLLGNVTTTSKNLEAKVEVYASALRMGDRQRGGVDDSGDSQQKKKRPAVVGVCSAGTPNGLGFALPSFRKNVLNTLRPWALHFVSYDTEFRTAKPIDKTAVMSTLRGVPVGRYAAKNKKDVRSGGRGLNCSSAAKTNEEGVDGRGLLGEGVGFSSYTWVSLNGFMDWFEKAYPPVAPETHKRHRWILPPLRSISQAFLRSLCDSRFRLGRAISSSASSSFSSSGEENPATIHDFDYIMFTRPDLYYYRPLQLQHGLVSFGGVQSSASRQHEEAGHSTQTEEVSLFPILRVGDIRASVMQGARDEARYVIFPETATLTKKTLLVSSCYTSLVEPTPRVGDPLLFGHPSVMSSLLSHEGFHIGTTVTFHASGMRRFSANQNHKRQQRFGVRHEHLIAMVIEQLMGRGRPWTPTAPGGSNLSSGTDGSHQDREPSIILRVADFSVVILRDGRELEMLRKLESSPRKQNFCSALGRTLAYDPLFLEKENKNQNGRHIGSRGAEEDGMISESIEDELRCYRFHTSNGTEIDDRRHGQVLHRTPVPMSSCIEATAYAHPPQNRDRRKSTAVGDSNVRSFTRPMPFVPLCSTNTSDGRALRVYDIELRRLGVNWDSGVCVDYISPDGDGRKTSSQSTIPVVREHSIAPYRSAVL